jgi:hypothetical protein
MVSALTFSKSYGACAWYDVMCKLQGNTSTQNDTSTDTSTELSTTTTSPSSESTIPQTTSSSGGDCDSSYPDFCIPSPPPDLNCPDIPQKRFTVSGADPHGFDGDGDGIGCES